MGRRESWELMINNKAQVLVRLKFLSLLFEMLGTSLAQLLNRLKLGWILWFVIKCLIQSLMEICYHDYLFFISILDMCLSPHVVQKRLYKKTSVGETHRDDGTKFDWEIHKLWKVINQGPRMTKRALRGYQSRPLGIPCGPAGPPPCHLALRFVHNQVWA
jgi:hypothetical protein